MLVAPIFQILLFAYIGRSAGVESDAFFVIGNAVQYSAIPCLFAMANTVAGERFTQTLGHRAGHAGATGSPLFLGQVAAGRGQRLRRVDVLPGRRLAAAGRQLSPATWLPLALVVGGRRGVLHRPRDWSTPRSGCGCGRRR